MRQLASGFEEEEALFGRVWGDTASASLFHDGLVVHIGIEAEEGEGEAVLAASFSVAGTGVAAASGEERLHIEFELDVPGSRGIFTPRDGREGEEDGECRKRKAAHGTIRHI